MIVCSTTEVFHYLRPDAAADSVASVLRLRLRPLSEIPWHPQYADQLAAEPEHFRERYERLAAPALGPAYSNSGVFFTTIDFRRMPGHGLAGFTRFAIPVERIDPARTVVTYQLGEADELRTHERFGPDALERAAELWTADAVERWLGAHPRGYFYHVPQVISFADGGIPVVPEDVQEAPEPAPRRP